MAYHHRLDPYPVPKSSQPLFVNEPWLVDDRDYSPYIKYAESSETDNVQIYVPLDLNKKDILSKLVSVIQKHGEVNWKNESDFASDVQKLIYQVEIYDQVWYVRHFPEHGRHSLEGIALVREIVALLKAIPDGCAECFPFDLIDELTQEYLTDFQETKGIEWINLTATGNSD